MKKPPPLRQVMFEAFNAAMDLANEAELAGGHTIHMMKQTMPCSSKRGKPPVMVPLVSFVVDGEPA